ncbi:cytochrome b-245 heavy chain-like [Anneissia japonica]|uniref:cytochrome b-245 heavy chain-like n=1 Tax=Anneissia japonica TaxID=1529436 RepID=UPI0014259702|nr:cytochrome b-245 heavy chain-like [Anneissia japonica]
MQRVAGWTGIFITMALLLMYTSSTEFIRRYYFETFWFTHHLFIIYYGFLIAHGAEGIVRHQTNVEDHNPKKCADYPDSWSTMDDCKNAPMFAGGELKSWKWVIAPLIIYFLEQVIRFCRSVQTVTITEVSELQF